MRIRGDIRSMLQGAAKACYFISNFFRYYLPTPLYKLYVRGRFAMLSQAHRNAARERARYYAALPLDAKVASDDRAVCVDGFRYPFGKKKKFSMYFFDLYQSMRLFPGHMRFNYIFGDIDWQCDTPTLVKARPIPANGDTTLSVLCRLNRLRHFRFISDRRQWDEKKDMLVFRNIVKKQPHRTAFIASLIDSPMCDVGQVNPDPDNPSFQKPYMPMEQMLGYKFIACIEGHDVATNLKWVMSSNSIAVMPRPRIESWFMEATLIPGVHYIEISPDYSDVEQKLRHYIDHPDEARAIIDNAHRYVARFRNHTLEQYTQYLTLKRYFEITNAHGQ